MFSTRHAGLIAIIQLETEGANIYLLLTGNKQLTKPLTFPFAFAEDNEGDTVHKHAALSNTAGSNFNFGYVFKDVITKGSLVLWGSGEKCPKYSNPIQRKLSLYLAEKLFGINRTAHIRTSMYAAVSMQ